MLKNKAGVWGEIHTVRYLRDRGYRILTTNFACRFGEVDVVAEGNGTIAFVEVKAREEDTRLRPAEAVDENKQNRLRLTAQQFLRVTGLRGAMRFDVSEVYLRNGSTLARIDYMENAF